MKEYLIGGISALDLVQRYGSPLYAYDAGSIREQYRKLSLAFERIPHAIHYACKANEAPEILAVLRDLGSGVDTVSQNEIKRALKVGFPVDKIIFTPSCPGLEELTFALDQGICIHFGSLEYLEMMGTKLSGRKIGIRLNPAMPINGNPKIATAHPRSKFGVPLDQLDKLGQLIKKYHIKLTTLHIHTGSDVANMEDLKKSFDVLISLLTVFPEVEALDIGSGLKIPYAPSDKPFDLTGYARYIGEKLNELNRPIRIILEPGKFLVARAGYLLTRVNVVKQGYQVRFVGVNSGFHHLIRPMYYGAYHHIVNVSNSEGEQQIYSVVGQLCEEDTFADGIALATVEPGHILCIENAGAYAYAMSMNYNLRDKPVELLIDQGKVRVISSETIQV